MEDRLVERTSGKGILNMTKQVIAAALVATAAVATIGPGGILSAQEPETFRATAEDVRQDSVYSPFANRAYPDQVFFGDTHLHTNLSPDAGLIGTTLDVHAAYRFARGETVTSNTGQRIQLVRPLDFLVVTDHAEYIGLAPQIRDSDPVLLADPYGRFLYEQFNAGPEGRMTAFRSILDDAVTGNNQFSSNDAVRSIWEGFVNTADTYDEPGRFTAMTGFEWTSSPRGDNLHRVVVFRDGADRTSRVLPFGTFDSEDPQDLWRYLANYESTTGGSAIAIPHNGNLIN